MSTPLSEALPTAYEFGRVIGRFLRAVGDGEDVDSVPEAVPAKGTVTFTPITTSRILIDSSSEPSPLITHEAIACTLDAYGHISRNGVRGVWLWTGEWNVSFNVSGISRTQFPILVTNAHTDVAPLDLWEAVPYTPPAGIPVTTMLVPSNPTDGYVLKWSAVSSSLVWGAAAPGDSSTITADDTPAAPAEGESASYFVTSAVTWPAGLVWSTDPDGGVAPTITGTALVSLFTVGGTTRAIMGATFPGVVVPDTAAPAWSATLTTGTPAATSVVVAASALATDAVGVTGYECSLNSGGSWTSVTPSGLNFTLTGLTAATAYPAPQFRAKDAAGNYSTPLTAQAFTTASGGDVTNPTPGTLASSAITSSGFTLTVTGASDAGGLHATPYAYSTDNGSTWSAWQAGATYNATGLAASTGYQARHKVRDAAGNVSTGTAKTVTTGSSAPVVLASDDFNRTNSTTGLGTATTGQTWTQHGTGIVGIIDNRAYRATTNAFASVDVGQADMKVSLTAVTPGDYFSGPLARVSADGLTFYWVDTGSGSGALARISGYINGAQVSPSGTSSFATVAGDTLAISCKENGAGGTVVKLFINGVEKQSITDTRAERPMGTRAGLRPFNNGNIRLDNFLVESV